MTVSHRQENLVYRNATLIQVQYQDNGDDSGQYPLHEYHNISGFKGFIIDDEA